MEGYKDITVFVDPEVSYSPKVWFFFPRIVLCSFSIVVLFKGDGRWFTREERPRVELETVEKQIKRLMASFAVLFFLQ